MHFYKFDLQLFQLGLSMEWAEIRLGCQALARNLGVSANDVQFRPEINQPMSIPDRFRLGQRQNRA